MRALPYHNRQPRPHIHRYKQYTDKEIKNGIGECEDITMKYLYEGGMSDVAPTGPAKKEQKIGN
jgi:hypothetical protein